MKIYSKLTLDTYSEDSQYLHFWSWKFLQKSLGLMNVTFWEFLVSTARIFKLPVRKENRWFPRNFFRSFWKPNLSKVGQKMTKKNAFNIAYLSYVVYALYYISFRLSLKSFHLETVSLFFFIIPSFWQTNKGSHI